MDVGLRGMQRNLSERLVCLNSGVGSGLKQQVGSVLACIMERGRPCGQLRELSHDDDRSQNQDMMKPQRH